MAKTLRNGKVLIDWSQNNGKKTTIAPYSMRGREHPTVAAPRTLNETADKKLEHLDCREVLERVDERLDPMATLIDNEPLVLAAAVGAAAASTHHPALNGSHLDPAGARKTQIRC